MKSKLLFLFVAVLSAAVVSCSDDKEVKKKGDPDLTHEGVRWNIVNIDYTLLDQSFSSGSIGQTFKEGSKANAGTFYFLDDEGRGSFELNVEGYNKEDAFTYSIDNDNINIMAISQSVGVKTNQNILTLSGSTTETERIISGTITKQSMSGQFNLTVDMVLERE